MKRVITLCAVIFVAGSVFSVPQVAAQKQKRAFKIRMGTLAPRDSSWYRILREMGEKWTAGTGGAVSLTIHAGGVAGDEDKMIRLMGVGQLHAAAITAAGLATIDSSVWGLMIPLMFESYDEWDYVREQLNSELEKKLEARGFVVLCWSDVGWVHFFSKKPLTHPDQLKRMKLAASATEPAAVEIMKWAGFNPVPIANVDIISGLQTGMIDSVYLPIIYAEATSVFRRASYMASLKWAPLQGAVVMSQAAWRRLSLEQQEVVSLQAEIAGRLLREDTRAREQASLKAMTGRKLTVIEVDKAAAAAWHKVMADAYPRIRGELVPADFFDKVQRLRDQYREGRGRTSP